MRKRIGAVNTNNGSVCRSGRKVVIARKSRILKTGVILACTAAIFLLSACQKNIEQELTPAPAGQEGAGGKTAGSGQAAATSPIEPSISYLEVTPEKDLTVYFSRDSASYGRRENLTKHKRSVIYS